MNEAMGLDKLVAIQIMSNLRTSLKMRGNKPVAPSVILEEMLEYLPSEDVRVAMYAGYLTGLNTKLTKPPNMI